MKHRRLKLLFISAALAYSIYLLNSLNTYMAYKDVHVEVMQTYSGTSTGKYGSMEFIVVYRTDDGTFFDRYVSASDYYQLEKGQKLVLNIRPSDIQQNWVKNIIWFFGPIVWWGIAGTFSLVTFLLAVWPDRRKKNEEA